MFKLSFSLVRYIIINLAVAPLCWIGVCVLLLPTVNINFLLFASFLSVMCFSVLFCLIHIRITINVCALNAYRLVKQPCRHPVFLMVDIVLVLLPFLDRCVFIGMFLFVKWWILALHNSRSFVAP